ncbi:MAG: dTDP-4-dehydrorhamnose reductase [Deltaproteobacteria bacterium]|nr:dTDP-4-dehydrorhamnose reductase [Deltaproteobacteria bacterium]
MKILVLGARGNLGGQLVKFLSMNERCDVIGLSNRELDITDQEAVFKTVKLIQPQAIINAAAYNAVDNCEKDDQEFARAVKLNGLAVGFLAEAAAQCQAVFVHYSTDYVFAGDVPAGYREEDLPHPISRYGQSKLMGEKALLQFKDSGLKWYLVRTSKLFGPPGHSAQAKPDFFSLMLKLSRERDTLEVVDDETSCFTYTPDLAQATLEFLDQRPEYGIYHLANTGPGTWYQAALELFRLSGARVGVRPVPSEYFPRPAKRPKFSVLLNTKLPPMRDYRLALKDYLEALHSVCNPVGKKDERRRKKEVATN